MSDSIIGQARKQFHKSLLDEGVLYINKDGNASNADNSKKSGLSSKRIANSIALQLQVETGEKMVGQTSGNKFEEIIEKFIQDILPHLTHLRAGKLHAAKLKGSHKSLPLAKFEQYKHLRALKEAADSDKRIAAAIGREYIVKPDIVVYRDPVTDQEINKDKKIIDESLAQKTDLRVVNGNEPTLVASVSAKWTIRSDRAQNSRYEALNLIRNRKGSLPRIFDVTAEPLPSRIASLALGTGDIDCVYHFALYELQKAALEDGNENEIATLNAMVDGKRLKDISDLVLDLVI